MSSFVEVARHWLAWMVAASWQLAVLVSIVAAVCYVARGVSPRLRHGLWLLVLAKVFLPPDLTTPLSVGRWAVAPLFETTGLKSIGAAPAWRWIGPRAEVLRSKPNMLGNRRLPATGRRCRRC